MMRKSLFMLLLLFGFVGIFAQTYDTTKVRTSMGTWKQETSYSKLNDGDVPPSRIIISSYITKQKILTHADFEQKQKTVSVLPKYRYELILVSRSRYNNKNVKTWIFNAKVYINDVEVTREQFPDGFSAIVDISPTVIYWYETSSDSLNFKINWKSSEYFQNK